MSHVVSKDALAALLGDAGRAHHDAFAHVNGDDPAWPRWYLAYVTPRLDGVMGREVQPEVDPEVLAAELAEAEQHRKAEDPRADWAAYYAGWLLWRWAKKPGQQAGQRT